MNCQVCDSSDLYEVLDLGHHPPSDAFLTEEDLNQPETLHPLKVLFCKDCRLVQLSYVAPPKLLFTDQYVYMSSSNEPFKAQLHAFAEKLIEKLGLSEKDFVVDIGSNDGTFLEPFINRQIKVVGVDPSSIAKVAIEKGIPTVNEFFDENIAKMILEKHGKAQLITGLNVFQHVKYLESLVKGVKALLDDSGIFVVQSHYLLDLIDKLQYDSIYLEHLRYYSLTSLINLLNRFDLEIFDADRIDEHGGSIRAFISRKGKHIISESVKEILRKEDDYKLHSIGTFENFRNRVNENRRTLNKLLHQIKSNGQRVVGIGAPAKGNTLLNFCKIDSSILDYLVETNEWKVGKYCPGTHIKIKNETEMIKDQPEYALLLPWNIKDDIIPKIRAKGYTGKIIVPNPMPAIVS